jgi:hypothetical protein
MFVYRQSETNKDLFTVGFFHLSGKWEVESNHNDRERAALRTAWLNGSGRADPSKFPSLKECLEDCRQLMADKKLTEQDECCIGATWSLIEKRMNIFLDLDSNFKDDK